MAQVTKTIKENSGSTYATWSLIANGTNVTASGENVTVPVPTIQAQYQYSGKNYASAHVTDAILTIGNNTSNHVIYYATQQAWPSGTKKTLTRDKTSVTIDTGSIFTSSNRTDKSVNIYLNSNSSQSYGYIELSSEKWSGGEDVGTLHGHYEGSTGLWGPLATVTLNAPPIFTSTQVTFDKNYVYTGITTATVEISNLEAQYGGTISEVKLTIGNQTATSTTNGNLSILLNKAGTFTPEVKVTDSRGQTTTKKLNAITVNEYTKPSVEVLLSRTNSTGIIADEGNYVVIQATINYSNALVTLEEPEVIYKDLNTTGASAASASVTWYTNWVPTTGVSQPVTWTNYNPSSPITLYGLASKSSGGFNSANAYDISVTPQDTRGLGNTITVTLSSGYYTIDFLAGGHGIAFGQSATNEGFVCNMEATFNQGISIPTGKTYKIGTEPLSPSDLSIADYVIEQGVTDSWYWKKWNSGRYEAERIRNIGQVSLSTVDYSSSTNTYVSGAVTVGTPPHTLVNGSVEVVYLGNSSNSGSWLQRTSLTQFRIAKATTVSTTVLQNVTVSEKVVGGTWK